MPYMIRVRDGRPVATHRGDLRGINVPDSDGAETFDDRDEFEARLAELEPPPGPDLDGLLDTLADDLPRDVARKVLDGYVVSALQRGKWDRAWGALADSHADGDLTDAQWDTIQQVAADHHLPAPESA